MKDSGFEVADDGRLIIPEDEGTSKKPEKESGTVYSTYIFPRPVELDLRPNISTFEHVRVIEVAINLLILFVNHAMKVG